VDILSESPGLRFIEETFAETCRLSSFCEIRTPILEDRALFGRSLGASSDVVRKEMFTLGGTPEAVLRPEGTAGVMRALLSQGVLFCMGVKFFQRLFSRHS